MSAANVGAQPAPGPVPVIVYLKDQPFLAEAAARQSEFQAQAAALLARVAAEGAPTHTPGGPPLTRAQEVAAAAAAPALDAASQARQAQALADLDTLVTAQRRVVYQAAAARVAASQAPVEDLIRSLGGTVTARITVVNALGAHMPAAALPALARHPAVAAVTPDTLAEGALDSSPGAIRAESFWNGGYTGGTVDVAVIDTGIVITHPALAGHTFLQDTFLATAGGSTTDTTPYDQNGHGTHIAGIIGSRDAALPGVAHGLGTLLNAKAGYDTDGSPGGASAMWESDSMDAAEWAIFEASQSAEVINLSFASCTSEDDTNWARFWDALVQASGVAVAVAAGNTSSCARVASPSIAYNVISVANVDDTNDTNRGNDFLDSGSSPGPTQGGRSKPDLAAPGAFITSSNAAWDVPGQPLFKFLTGTSMAAPHVAGAAALLRQAGVTDPRAIKALLINTAEDKGVPGWDTGYGWGYLDLAHAFAHRGDSHLSDVSNATPYRLFKGPAVLSDTATLVWHRHITFPCAAHSCSTAPISNLNLALYSAATNSLLDTSATLTDTVEQVQAPGASDQNVVRVSLLSLNPALTHEDFALATEEGFTPAVGPLLADGSFNHVVPVNEERQVDLRLVNNGDLPAHGVVLTVTVPSGLNLPPGATAYNVGVLAPGGVYTVTHTVTLQQDEARQFTLAATSNSYGATFAFNDTVSVVPVHAQQWLPLVHASPVTQ